MANQYTAYRFISDTHKECSYCGKIKLHSEFHKDSLTKRNRGLAYYCRDCANAKSREWHKKNGKKPEHIYNQRDRYFKQSYGLSVEEYTKLLEAQNYCCALCGVEFSTSGRKNRGHLDHCHKTGKIRAMLCNNCNRGLGHFKENTKVMSKAIDYIKAHNQ